MFFLGWASDVGQFARLERNSAKSNLEVARLKYFVSSIALEIAAPFVLYDVSAGQPPNIAAAHRSR